MTVIHTWWIRCWVTYVCHKWNVNRRSRRLYKTSATSYTATKHRITANYKLYWSKTSMLDCWSYNIIHPKQRLRFNIWLNMKIENLETLVPANHLDCYLGNQSNRTNKNRKFGDVSPSQSPRLLFRKPI